MERFFILHEGQPRQVMLKLDHYGSTMPGWVMDIIIVVFVAAILIAGVTLWAAR